MLERKKHRLSLVEILTPLQREYNEWWYKNEAVRFQKCVDSLNQKKEPKYDERLYLLL